MCGTGQLPALPGRLPGWHGTRLLPPATNPHQPEKAPKGAFCVYGGLARTRCGGADPLDAPTADPRLQVISLHPKATTPAAPANTMGVERMGDNTCVVCGGDNTCGGAACLGCRTRIHTQLAALPDRVAALTHHLVPLRGAAQERVTVSPTAGSPAGARLDVLTLTGPGSESPTPPPVDPAPVVRRWAEPVTVTIDVDRLIPLVGIVTTQEHRTVTVWHEAVVVDDDGNPITRHPNDQVGELPPAVWLDSWVRAWRSHFGHHTRPPQPPPPPPAPPVDRRVVLWFATHHPDGPAVVGGWVAVARAWRDYQAATLLGQFPGRGGRPTPAWTRRDDPVVDEWTTRFGSPDTPTRVHADVTYLLTWLDAACDQDVGVAAFAAELGSLTAQLVTALGERPDQQWLGRCPAHLTTPTSTTRLCGAGLWQDPYASQVQCGRCRTTWGPARRDLLQLAAAIRRHWPLDRRRRYTAGQRPTGVLCPTCRGVVEVGWREVTARVDTQRWWQPERVVCPAGCPEAERII